jgi:hypothetical protein
MNDAEDNFASSVDNVTYDKLNEKTVKCVRCKADISAEDNFCWNCGDWTAKGYHLAKEGTNKKNETSRMQNKLNKLLLIFSFAVLLFFGMTVFRGNDMYRPLFFVRRKVTSLFLGYNTSIIKTDSVYLNQKIEDLDDAHQIIIKDANNQRFKCSRALDTYLLEGEIEDAYKIPSVNFCDITHQEAEKIKAIIDKMYKLFPGIEGALTNISITNSMVKGDYVAYFQPVYQFVNVHGYNKVNKSQILLNSYYFLNDDVLKDPITTIVDEGWFVKDVTWETTIAHELGHYVSFYTILKEHNMENVTLVTKENEKDIQSVIDDYDNGVHSKKVIEEAVTNYNNKYDDSQTAYEFACSISNYACYGDNNGELIYDEIIAESIHDYFIHGNKAEKQSLEVVKIIKSLMR